jgi:hypothetical protein
MNRPKVLLSGDERLSAFRASGARDTAVPLVVCWREWASLPELGIAQVEAKIDTGARTSALHANSIEAFERDGARWVRFDVTGEAASVPWHEAPVADRRSVRSSNGETEVRYVIRTALSLAGHVWPVEISLTNRERMELPMLIGRAALAGRALVDAEKSWLCGRPRWRSVRRRTVRPVKPRRRKSGEQL